ncbi:MAG: tetratricopeptide repeat protein [Candidatus Latescibacteria bacterium]|nr:tetratricopeptide repeat protein [Candidatus Latescibacterota bacterium]
MSREPVLYIGTAAPLVEMARVWLAKTPGDSEAERREKSRAFPHDRIGAYDLSFPRYPDLSDLAFCTGMQVSEERVCTEVNKWAGNPPRLVSNRNEAIGPIDHRKALAELRNALQDQPVQIISRIGLTLQQFQRDLSDIRPELVLLDCHGTEEGFLLFEDGRALADFIPGERLFPLLKPRPRVLFLAACHSETVLTRAKAEADWSDSVIVHVLGETPIEVTACVAFQSMLYAELLRGETAGEAFDAAKRYLANDPILGDLSVAIQEIAPSAKFRINEAGRDVRLPPTASVEAPPKDVSPPSPRRSAMIRRTSDRFVGRRREMAQVIDALLPVRAGIGRGEQRIVTLTKEGGIGKTTMATEVSDWAGERGLFPGGVFELSCERFTTDQELLTGLLTLFGVPPADQRGDLLALLTAVLPQVIPQGQPALLLLDNLDDLFGQHTPREVRDRATAALETALTVASDLRILATCRWPLGLSDYETEQEVIPMAEDEARDVFVSHLDSPAPAHLFEIQETWEQPDSIIRQIVQMSGRHPQSLQLLARQMRRKGMTLEKLRDEAHEDLLKVLTHPFAQDDEKDRLKKVEVSYELSYRHLSDHGKRLFEKLSRLPGGVWCGKFAEHSLDWHNLLGEGWRETLEKELDYFALVHYEPDGPGGETGVFEMLRPMLEFAWKKYEAAKHGEWEKTWIEFWRQRVGAWDEWISGRLPDEADVPEDQRGAAGARQQQLATALFARTKANWLAVFEHAAKTDGPLTRWFLLELVTFCELSGQRILLRTLAQQAVTVLHASGPEENLASCLVTLGNVQRDLGEREEAKESYQEALEIYRRFAKVHPAAFDQAVAMTLNNLGTVQGDLGEREEAKESYQEALEIQRRLAEVHPAAFDQDVAMTLNNLGTVQRELCEWEAARKCLIEALEIQRRLAEVHPAVFDHAVATTLDNLGNVQRALGEREEAKGSYQEALEIRRRLAQVHPAAFDQDVATTLNNLGVVQRDLGEREEAKESYQEALEIQRRLAEVHPAAFDQDVAGTLNNLGVVQRDLGEREEALEIYRRLAKVHPAAFDQDVAMTLNKGL